MDLGLALGIASLIATAIIGGASFYFTYKTSTAAMQKSLQLSSKMKIAEFRMKWIDEFRLDLAQLMKIHAELILIKRREMNLKESSKSLAAETIEQRRACNVEAMMLRGRLLLRLKPHSIDTEEAELETHLQASMEKDPDKADKQRKRIHALSRILLKREWDRVKTELQPNS